MNVRKVLVCRVQTWRAARPVSWRLLTLGGLCALVVGGSGCVTMTVVGSIQSAASARALHQRQVAWKTQTDALRQQARQGDAQVRLALAEHLLSQDDGHDWSTRRADRQEALGYLHELAAQGHAYAAYRQAELLVEGATATEAATWKDGFPGFAEAAQAMQQGCVLPGAGKAFTGPVDMAARVGTALQARASGLPERSAGPVLDLAGAWKAWHHARCPASGPTEDRQWVSLPACRSSAASLLPDSDGRPDGTAPCVQALREVQGLPEAPAATSRSVALSPAGQKLRRGLVRRYRQQAAAWAARYPAAPAFSEAPHGLAASRPASGPAP